MFKEKSVTPDVISKRKLAYGVGINNAPYQISMTINGKAQKCPYYRVWIGVLQRCFDPKFHKRRPTYKTCTVDPKWLVFSNFKNWMQAQDWEGLHLDKDIIIRGNKHYSADTCLFVSLEINNLFTLRQNYKGKYPLGVSKLKIGKYTYYVASCSFYGKQKRLGYFKNIKEAEHTYLTAKKKHIRQLCRDLTNTRLKTALLRHLD